MVYNVTYFGSHTHAQNFPIAPTNLETHTAQIDHIPPDSGSHPLPGPGGTIPWILLDSFLCLNSLRPPLPIQALLLKKAPCLRPLLHSEYTGWSHLPLQLEMDPSVLHLSPARVGGVLLDGRAPITMAFHCIPVGTITTTPTGWLFQDYKLCWNQPSSGRPYNSLLLTLDRSPLSPSFPIIEIMPEHRAGSQKWKTGV